MQPALTTITPTGAAHTQPAPAKAADPAANPLAHYQIIRRNGAVVPFEPNKIAIAMMKAFLAVHGTQGAASASVRETVDTLTQAVIRALVRSRPGGGVSISRVTGTGEEKSTCRSTFREDPICPGV